MLAPSSETAAGVAWKAPARVKVDLIAWDPESPAHVKRMLQHRIACGWKQEYVEGWRVLQREGKMGLQWVVSFSFCLASLLCDFFSFLVLKLQPYSVDITNGCICNSQF